MAIRKIETQDFDSRVIASESPLVVLFEAEWCPFCTQFRGILERRVDNIDIPVVAVRLNDYDNPLWERFSIGAVPTLAMFENGAMVFRIDSPLGIGLDDSDVTKLIDFVRTRTHKA